MLKTDEICILYSIVSVFIQMQIKKKLKSTMMVFVLSSIYSRADGQNFMLYSGQQVVLWPLFSDSSKLPSELDGKAANMYI